ncbi:hypothetical protein M422DRAFT_120735, partial [Sphaerobolus stellatus SS14]
PSELNMDNQSAISVSKRPEHMGLIPVYVQTNDMIADLLTKALPRELTDHFRKMMGLV